MTDTQGRPVRMVGTGQDITERKRLEEQLRHSQKLEGIGTLASGIAHDFNNILNIISAYCSLAEREQGSPKLASHLASIQKAVERGSGVVRGVLAFAREGESVFRPINLRVLLEEFVPLLRETFPRQIRVVLEASENLPVIAGDSDQLQQVLLNLCVNARDAMPAGGELSIRVAAVPRESAPGTAEGADGQCLCLEIADTGVGMDETVRQRIFEPFFTTKPEGQGAGMGLSVVYGVIKKHGGTIEVETSPGRGSRFRVFFPSSTGEQLRSDPVRKTGAGRSRCPAGTILLVEDEPMLRDGVRMLLEMEGYRVLTAGDGPEAVQVHLAHRGVIALVIADLGLPRLGGREAFDEMKRIDPSLKAIAVSGDLSAAKHSEILSSEILAFLPKPYSAEQMVEKIQEILSETES